VGLTRDRREQGSGSSRRPVQPREAASIMESRLVGGMMMMAEIRQLRRRRLICRRNSRRNRDTRNKRAASETSSKGRCSTDRKQQTEDEER
jgi:hypothetical protein